MPRKARVKRGRGIGDFITDLGLSAIGGLTGVDNEINRLYPGEKHGILTLPDGRRAFAQYMGPSTQVTKRLLRGDPGLTNVDKASKAHDIRYSLAKNDYDIRRADRLMMEAVSKFPDNLLNKAQASLIKIKQGLDRLGFKVGSTYGSDELDDPRILALYKTELGKLIRMGFGRAKK